MLHFMKGSPITKIKPFPKRNKLGIETLAILVDDVPKNLILIKEYPMDTWNDVLGFQKSNKGRFVDQRETLYDFPESNFHSTNERPAIMDGLLAAEGDRIITKNYDVYKVIGYRGNKLKERSVLIVDD